MFRKINNGQENKNPEEHNIEQRQANFVEIKKYKAPAEIKKQLDKKQ